MLALWLVALALNALGVTALTPLLTRLFELGMTLSLLAVLSGVLLDYRALKRTPALPASDA